MHDAGDLRTANLLGALSLAVADRLRATGEEAARHGAAAPAALVALHQFLGGASVDDLRGAVGLSHSGAVRLVDRLADDGLVERRPGADARSVSVVLTPKGRRVARKVLAARARVLDDLVGALEPAQREALAGLLEALVGTVVADRLAVRAAGGVPDGGWLCRLCDAEACGRPTGDCPAAAAATPAAP